MEKHQILIVIAVIALVSFLFVKASLANRYQPKHRRNIWTTDGTTVPRQGRHRPGPHHWPALELIPSG